MIKNKLGGKMSGKRILAIFLAVLMVFTATDFSTVLNVQAKSDGTKTITGFAALADNIKEQQVAVGTEEKDLNLPDTLSVTVLKNISEETAAVIDNITTKKTSLAGATVTLTGTEDFVYDGKEKIPAGITVTLGDTTLAPEQYTVSYANSNLAATGKETTYAGTVTVTILASDTGDYSGTVTKKPTYVIAPKPLTANVTADRKVYDTKTDATVNATVNTGIADEALTITGLTGTYTDADAGRDKSINIDGSGAKVTAAESTRTEPSNYKVTYPASIKGVIQQATGAITIPAGMDKISQTCGSSILLEGIPKTGDGTLTYTVSDSKDAAGTGVADDQITEVFDWGWIIVVTGRNAGTATITIAMEATTNYTAAESKTISVTVNKDTAPVIESENRSYAYSVGSRDQAVEISMADKLPREGRRGTTSYQLTAQTDTHNILSDVSVDAATGVLSYKVASGTTIGDSASITMTAIMNNYNDAAFTVNISITDQTLVEVKSGSEVQLIGGSTGSTLTYGQSLSELTLNTSGTGKAVFVEQGTDTVVEGTLAWTDGSIMPDITAVGSSYSAEWTFTPSDTISVVLTGTLPITVSKATPTVATPTATEFTYDPAKTLASVTLNGANGSHIVGGSNVTVEGSWVWKTSTSTPVVNNSGYTAVFTPNDTTNYNTVERKVTVAVTKATPVVNVLPTASAITYGQTLRDSVLSNGTAKYSNAEGAADVAGVYTWTTETTKPAFADSGVTEYGVTFTPADTENYNSFTEKVTLTVNKATNAPNMPGTAMTPAHAKETVGDVTLPTGWIWDTSDATKALSDGVAVTATANYNGADKGNYKNESVEITLTRANCDHTNTEVRGAIAATCTVTGYTGDTYCKDCNTLILSGTTIPALGHTGGTATCKKQAVCARCGEHYGALDPSNHTHTEIRNAKSATCTTEGYTGDKYCSDCGAKLSSGTTTTALGHNYAGKVTKQPTTTEEGVRTYTCSRCGASYTKPIAKLSSDATEPQIKGDDGKKGWEVITDNIEKAKEGDTVTVDMNGTTTVPGNVIDSIKGRDITVVIDLGNGISWKINGKDVTADNAGDIDFGVTTGTNTIPVDVINEVTGEKYSIQISLAYDGEFGFTATLSVNMEEKNAGFYANLFYYNESTGKLEFMNAGKINADGTVELKFTHASDYTIVVSDVVMDGSSTDSGKTDDGKTDSTKQETSPQTGDHTDVWKYIWLVILGGIILIIGFGTIIVKKRKETEE